MDKMLANRIIKIVFRPIANVFLMVEIKFKSYSHELVRPIEILVSRTVSEKTIQNW